MKKGHRFRECFVWMEGWVEVVTGVEDYSTFSVEQTVVVIIGNKDPRESLLMEEIFLIDLNPQRILRCN